MDEVVRALAFVVDYSANAAQELSVPQVAAVATETVAATATTDAGKPVTPANPDDVPQDDADAPTEKAHAADSYTAAWASFVQALLASGEFRYVR